MRSPSRQARTVSAAPIASAASVTSPPAPSAASTSQSPKRARPGTGRLDGLGRRGVRGARVKRSVPYSATARRPPPRSSADAAAGSPSARISSASRARAERGSPAARSASRRSTRRRERRAAARAAPSSGIAGPPPSSCERLVHRGSSTSASSRSWRAGLGDRALGRGAQLAQRRRAPRGARARARSGGSAFEASSRQSRPARAAVVAHLVARDLEQRPHQRARGAAPCPAARARPGDTARR